MRKKLYDRWKTTCARLQDMLTARVKRVFSSFACPPFVSGKLARFVLVALLLSAHHAEASKVQTAWRGLQNTRHSIFQDFPLGETVDGILYALCLYVENVEDVEDVEDNEGLRSGGPGLPASGALPRRAPVTRGLGLKLDPKPTSLFTCKP